MPRRRFASPSRPTRAIPNGHTFTITVNYTGAPGVHHDGDGSEEGWFRAADGNWMATEPVGSKDWMPLNDYPGAKPTYYFSITTEHGKTAIANGQRVSVTDNAPDAAFPKGSTTTVWHAPMPIASYLALTVVGDYSEKVHTVDDRRYYAFQDRRLPARLRAQNAAVIAMQPGITRFEERFAGPFPFASDGSVAGPPGTASSDEEMVSMIVFPYRFLDPAVLYHENFHQWWGDNVSEGNFDMAFYKEGMATLSVQLYSSTTARPARRACRSSSSNGLTPPTTAPSRRSPDRGCTATRSTPMAARRPAVA